MSHDPELCATCQLHLDLYGESFWDANKGEHISPLHIFRYRERQNVRTLQRLLSDGTDP